MLIYYSYLLLRGRVFLDSRMKLTETADLPADNFTMTRSLPYCGETRDCISQAKNSIFAYRKPSIIHFLHSTGYDE